MTYTVTAYTGDKIAVGTAITRQPYTATVDAGMRGNVGYTGSAGAGYTGSQGIQGNTGYTGSYGPLNPSAHITQMFEPVTIFTGSSGEVIHNCNNGTYIFFVYPTGNIVVNLINLNINVGETTTIKGSILQSNTSAYMMQTLKIDGIIPSTYWENGVIASGNIGMVNDIKFELYRPSADNYVVKASSKVYAQV